MRPLLRAIVPIGLILSVLGCSFEEKNQGGGGSAPATTQKQSAADAPVQSPEELAAARARAAKVYRSPQELIAEMPPGTFPKAGSQQAVERAAASKWLNTNLPLGELESTLIITGIVVEGNDPFRVFISVKSWPEQPEKPSWGYAQRTSGGVAFGSPVSLGGQICQVVQSTLLDSVTSSLANYIYTCTSDEAIKLRELNGKRVKFRAAILEARVGRHLEFEDERSPLELHVRTTQPSLNGFLPIHHAGGGGGFPAGTFAKEGHADRILRIEPGKVTVVRDKKEIAIWLSEPEYGFTGPLFSLNHWNATGTPPTLLEIQGDPNNDWLSGKWRLTK